MNYAALEKCRICGSPHLTPVIDLGAQMLATVTVTEENKDRYPKEKVPLVVVRCDKEKNPKGCGLVQMKYTYPSTNIYREYWYRSGVNQTMRDVLKDVVESAMRRVDLRPEDTVLDIGCNDGTLLSNYDPKLNRIGIDPVENIRGENETFTRVIGFFNAANFNRVAKGKKAKIMTSIAMFYDLEDPNAFVADIATCLADDGIWIVQMADLPEMLQNNMYDQIVHEHLEYYHIEPFRYLVEQHGLKVVDIEKNLANGSSYRFSVRKEGSASPSPEAHKRMEQWMKEEEALHLTGEAIYDRFRKDVLNTKEELIRFVRSERAKGKTIFGYGASTKGNVILQYCGFTSEDISCIADRNQYKWNGETVGTHIPIISEEEARRQKPDYFLVLPYYFAQEMMVREKEYLKHGGKFVIPLPHVSLLDASALPA